MTDRPVSVFVDNCPECETTWAYGDGQFSRIIGIYDPDRDRTVEWMCPGCAHRWPRQSQAILKPEHRSTQPATKDETHGNLT